MNFFKHSIITAVSLVAFSTGCASNGPESGEGISAADVLAGAVILGGLALIKDDEDDDVSTTQQPPSPAEPDNSGNFQKYITTVTPRSINLCPHQVGGGDREFDGNGPSVTASAVFKTVRGRTTRDGVSQQLVVEVNFRVKETKSDWSEARGSRTSFVHSVPSGGSIRVLSDRRSSWEYVDVNHAADTKFLASTELVRRFEAKGDTSGNDIGNCTGDDSYLKVDFNPVEIEVSTPVRS